MHELHRTVLFLARAMAILGGAVLLALILLTCVSVIGLSLNKALHSEWVESIAPDVAQGLLNMGIGPITGDFELVEAGMAFAIFAFLPLCQVAGGHATVDIFTARFPIWLNRIIQLIVDVTFALVLALIAWRLYEGMLDKQRYNEATFMLNMPLWWAYAVSVGAAVLAALVAVYVAFVRAVEIVTGRSILNAASDEAQA